MQVFVGASNIEHPLEARRWVSDLDYNRLFRDLERWACQKEPLWGECYFFIECTLPRGERLGGRRSQLDLLISFSTRLAICELKSFSHCPSVNRIGECCVQVNGQIRRLGALINDAGFSDDCIGKILFLPGLNHAALSKVSDHLDFPHAAHHIWPTGADLSLRNLRYGDRPLYLVSALDEYLSMLEPKRGRGSVPLQEFLCNRLQRDGGKLRRFENFRFARAYLQTISPAVPVLHDEWYVPALRQREVATTLDALQKEGMILLVGPPGAGKSTLAREIIQKSEVEYYETSIPNECRTVAEICHSLNSMIRGEASNKLGADTLIQHLAAEPYLFWIRHFEDCSAGGLAEVLQKFKTCKKIDPARYVARWIVETSRFIDGLDAQSFPLPAFDSSQLIRILQRISPGGGFDDAEDVVRLAHGNPDRARRLWQSRSATDANLPDQLTWFRQQLSAQEGRVLSLMCLATSKSPFGVSLETLTAWSSTVLGQPLTSIRTSVYAVVEMLERHRLARVTRFSRDMFDGLLDSLLPNEFSATVVADVSQSLIEATTKALSVEKRAELHDLLHDLLAGGNSDSLAHVTLGMSWYDLEPFFRSPFRFTSLSKTVGWIDRTNWADDVSHRTKYVLKAMRLLTQIRNHSELDAENELEAPNSEDDLEVLAFEAVSARIFLSRQLDNPTFHLDEWLESIEQKRDITLKAELLIATAMSLQHSRRPNKSTEAWNILNSLWERFQPDSTQRCFAIYQTLAFLNRTKARSTAVSDETSYQLIQKLAPELIETGARLNNVQLLCEALFYLVRSQEFRKGRTSYAEVLGYRTALRYIEEYQGRTVMRLQVLLTQGSVHRHYCRQDQISWSDFHQHMLDGFECYSRALKSAMVHKHLLHILNSIAYMMDFCFKALRFAELEVARDGIAERCREVVSVWDRHEAVVVDAKSREESNIVLSIKREVSLLMHLVLVSELNDDSAFIDSFQKRFRMFVDDWMNELSECGTRELRREITKRLEDGLKRLYRILFASQKYDPQRNKYVVGLIQSDLHRLLFSIKNFAKQGRLISTWRKTVELLATITKSRV